MRPERALCRAAETGNLEEVKRLVEQGASPSYLYHNPIWLAASEGHIEIVDYLAEHGSAFHWVDCFAFWHAADRGHTELISFVKKKNKYRVSTLLYGSMLALWRGYFKTAMACLT